MPRGKRVSPNERHLWLEAYDKGTPLRVIAGRFHRDVSTITRSLAGARQEREQQALRERRLLEAHSGHEADLLGAAETLLARVKEHGGLGELDFDRRTRLLVDGLREHDPQNPIWEAVNGVIIADKGISDSESELKERTRTLLVRLFGEGPDGIDSLYMDSFTRGVLTIARRGHATDDELTLRGYDDRPEGELLTPIWNSLHFARRPVSQPTALRIKDVLLRLHRDAASWKEAQSLRQYEAARKAHLETVERAIDVMVLRHLVPGRCELCPR